MKRYNSILFFLAAIVFSSASCSKLSIEHDEARNVEIMDIDFSRLNDGLFPGFYAGGIYGWRENECEVTVKNQTVTEIHLISSEAEYTTAFLDTLYNRIISQQTLQVDVVSGATLDSKACLKAVEDAILKAADNTSDKKSGTFIRF